MGIAWHEAYVTLCRLRLSEYGMKENLLQTSYTNLAHCISVVCSEPTRCGSSLILAYTVAQGLV